MKKILMIVLAGSLLTGTVLFETSGFWPILLLVILLYFFITPIGGLTDSLNYRIAEIRGFSFGSVRLFGSVGFGITALMVGYLIDVWGIGSLSYLFFGFGILAIISCFRLPDVPASQTPITLSNFRKIFGDRQLLWYLFIVLLLAIPSRMNDTFLGVYMKSLNGSTGLIGQSWFYATFSEALIFGLSVWWLQKGKELPLMAIAAFLYGIRFLLCAMSDSPQWLAILQLLHGLTFAVFYAAGVQYLNQVIPSEWRSTGQTVFQVVFFEISSVIGSIVGGWIIQGFSGFILYLIMAAISIVAMLMVFVTMWKQKEKVKKGNDSVGTLSL